MLIFQDVFGRFLLGLPTYSYRGCGWTPRCPTLLRFGSKNRGVTRQPASEHSELLYLPPRLSRLFLDFFGGRIPTHVPISKLNSAAVAGIPVYAMDSVRDHRLVFVQWWWIHPWQWFPTCKRTSMLVNVSHFRRRYLLHLDSDATFNCRGSWTWFDYLGFRYFQWLDSMV